MASGVANHHRLLRHIPQHDRARSYHCVSSNGNPSNDGCIGPYGSTFPHQCGNQLLTSLPELRTRPSIVGENGVWAYKHAILNRDQIPERNTVLERYAIADLHRGLDKGMIADVAIPANDRAAHHMGKCPYAGPGANGCRLDQRLWMDEDVPGLIHVLGPYCARSFSGTLQDRRNGFE
jgi:hypothetical protein